MSKMQSDREQQFSSNVAMSHVKGGMNPNWIVMDNATTAHVTKNGRLLNNAHDSDSAINIDSAGGIAKTKRTGDLPGVKDPLWHASHGVANTLSFALLAEQCEISCDCEKDEFVVHMGECGDITFHRSVDGSHCCDTSHWFVEDDDKSPVEENQSSKALVDAAKESMEGLTKRKIKNAESVRKTGPMVGRPSPKDFLLMTKEGMLRNAPIAVEDIKNADQTFGPQEVGSLNGKSVRQDPTPVATDIVEAPRGTLKHNKEVVLTGDVVFVNSLPIVVTHSHDINFTTVDLANNELAKASFGSVKNTVHCHKMRKFSIKTSLMDSEFESLHGLLLEKKGCSKCCSSSGACTGNRATHSSH